MNIIKLVEKLKHSCQTYDTYRKSIDFQSVDLVKVPELVNFMNREDENFDEFLDTSVYIDVDIANGDFKLEVYQMIDYIEVKHYYFDINLTVEE